MTPEKKKSKYMYYRCTGARGQCGNTYIREEKLAKLLGSTITPIQIAAEIADDIADALAAGEHHDAEDREAARHRLESQRRTVTVKLDRGYDDFVSGKISEEFWNRRSKEWESEIQTIDVELAGLSRTRPAVVATGAKILELAKNAENLYKPQDPAEQRKLLETVLSNSTFDRGSLSGTYAKPFDLLVRGNETGEWRREWDSCRERRAEREVFEA